MDNLEPVPIHWIYIIYQYFLLNMSHCDKISTIVKISNFVNSNLKLFLIVTIYFRIKVNN